MNSNRIIIVLIIVILLSAFAGGIWFFFFRSTATLSTSSTTNSNGFNVNIPSNSNTTTAPTDTNGSETINTTAGARQKIFEVTTGPVVSATLIQTLRPTTTVARYIRQDDGHVYDVPLGVSGAVPKVVSNITIPGGQRAIWLEGGNAAVMQYVDSNTVVKTVYLGFPQATTTNVVLPTKIQFLPDNIIDIAGSPDGKSVVYLIKTAAGSDGYIAKSDGTGSRKVFSLPLSEMLLVWPSANTILATTKAATGINGIAFAVDVKTGNASVLVSGSGLSATADPSFATILYQTANTTDGIHTYVHNTKTNTDIAIFPAVAPEKCISSILQPLRMYCASPLSYQVNNEMDLWHQGVLSDSNDIFSLSLATGTSKVVTIPGSNDGGAASDILQMALSPDEHYLSYVTKGDHSLWGVLLTQ